jgi:hypothetical protein
MVVLDAGEDSLQSALSMCLSLVIVTSRGAANISASQISK